RKFMGTVTAPYDKLVADPIAALFDAGDFKVVFGTQSTTALDFPSALQWNAVLGSRVNLLFHPTSILSGGGPAAPTYGVESILKDLLLGIGGDTKMVWGQQTSCIYGSQTHVERGPLVYLRSDSLEQAQLAVRVLLGLIAATSMAGAILAKVNPTSNGTAQTIIRW